MYNNLNIDPIIENANKTIMVTDREKYDKYLDELETYCEKNNILIGGNVGLNLLLKKPHSRNDYVYYLYSYDALRHTKNIMGIFYNIPPIVNNELSTGKIIDEINKMAVKNYIGGSIAPDDTAEMIMSIPINKQLSELADKYTIDVFYKTVIEYKEFEIVIGTRTLVKFFQFEKHTKGTLLQDALPKIECNGYFGATQNKKLLLIHPLLRLIELYKSLYNPYNTINKTTYTENLIIEHELFPLMNYKIRNLSGLTLKNIYQSNENDKETAVGGSIEPTEPISAESISINIDDTSADTAADSTADSTNIDVINIESNEISGGFNKHNNNNKNQSAAHNNHNNNTNNSQTSNKSPSLMKNLHINDMTAKIIQHHDLTILQKFLPNSDHILIGDYAIEYSTSANKTNYSLIDAANKLTDIPRRMQIITSMAPEFILSTLKTLLNTQLHSITHIVNLPQDFQLSKYTIYAITNRGYFIPIVDIFNSTTYELIPYTLQGGIKLGNITVLMRFKLIDMWSQHIISGFKKNEFLQQLMARIETQILILREKFYELLFANPENIFQLSNYSGKYQDEIISKRIIREDQKQYSNQYFVKSVLLHQPFK